MTEAARPPSTTAMVAGLGAAQLVAWGVLFYAIAVLGEPMRTELAQSKSEVFGAFTWSMAVSGVLAPWAGKLLDARGGRRVLVWSVVLGALGFCVLGLAHSWFELALAWSINGVAMALGLYDTCFAVIGQAAPAHYRRTVTGVTLVAGFASTVFWPTTHYLVRGLGWRYTCLVFAGLLLLCAPVYLLVLPSGRRAVAETPIPQLADADIRRRARILAVAFAGAALIAGSLSAHLVSVLEALHLSTERAIWIASSIGALQVLGRLVDFFYGRVSARRLGLLTFCGLLTALLLLSGTARFSALAYAFAFSYGVSNGLLTIAKATLPVQMFGMRNVGAVLGSFSAPSQITRALAPLAFALLSEQKGVQYGVLATLGVAVASLAAYLAGTRGASHALADG